MIFQTLIGISACSRPWPMLKTCCEAASCRYAFHLNAAAARCTRRSQWRTALRLLGRKVLRRNLSATVNALKQGERWDLALALFELFATRGLEADASGCNALASALEKSTWRQVFFLRSWPSRTRWYGHDTSLPAASITMELGSCSPSGGSGWWCTGGPDWTQCCDGSNGKGRSVAASVRDVSTFRTLGCEVWWCKLCHCHGCLSRQLVKRSRAFASDAAAWSHSTSISIHSSLWCLCCSWKLGGGIACVWHVKDLRHMGHSSWNIWSCSYVEK